jgi:predicted outer membrane repeat protein
MIRIRLIIAAILAFAVLGLMAQPSFASSTVTDCPSDGSALSNDISRAGNGGTVNLVCTSSSQDIPFSSTITISKSVTLSASSSPVAVIFDGGGSHELFSVDAGASLELDNLWLENSAGDLSGQNAGAIYVSAGLSGIFGGRLTVNDSTFESNTSHYNGGAIRNDGGTVTISRSTFNGNLAVGGCGYTDLCLEQHYGDNGGAIYNLGTMAISDSTFTNNTGRADPADGGRYTTWARSQSPAAPSPAIL